MGPSTVFHQPERIAAELKIVPPLVDTVGPVAFDIDAPFHVGQKPIKCGRSRFKADVGWLRAELINATRDAEAMTTRLDAARDGLPA
jgi:hypothetical protein